MVPFNAGSISFENEGLGFASKTAAADAQDVVRNERRFIGLACLAGGTDRLVTVLRTQNAAKNLTMYDTDGIIGEKFDFEGRKKCILGGGECVNLIVNSF